MGGIVDIQELKQFMNQHQVTTTNTTTGTAIGPVPKSYPAVTPALPPTGGLLGHAWNGWKPVVLSDSDIELMAICIANKHPQMEGHAGCFCAMKRLEKGISKG